MSDFIASVADVYFIVELAINISRIVEFFALSCLCFAIFVIFVFFAFLEFSIVMAPEFELELRFFMRNIRNSLFFSFLRQSCFFYI